MKKIKKISQQIAQKTTPKSHSNTLAGIAFVAGLFLTWGLMDTFYSHGSGLFVGLGVGFLAMLTIKIIYRNK